MQSNNQLKQGHHIIMQSKGPTQPDKSSMYAFWVAKVPYLQATRKDSPGWSMSSLGIQFILFVLSCSASKIAL